MIGALLYLQARSFQNLGRVRLLRLRQPKYLVGAVFGAAYFGWIFGQPFLMASRRGSPAALFSGWPADLWEILLAGGLLLLAALTWLLPQKRASLVFTEAEIAFLFPAPVSRATLIRYKLGKAQLGILLTAGFVALLSLRSGGPASAGRRAFGMWALFTLMNLHALGAGFTQTILLGGDRVTGKRRAIYLLIALAAVAGAATWVALRAPVLQAADLGSAQAMAHYAQRLAESPPGAALLAPFRAAARPVFAPDGRAFLWAAGPTLALLAAHYWWVVRMEVAFEESSIEASRRHAARVARMREGNPWATRPRRKARAPFPLAPRGPVAVAVLWKNLIGAGQAFSLRIWLPVCLWGLSMGYVFHRQANGSVWPSVVATSASVLAGASILVGPQLFRQDFRQDMGSIDLLKTYPVSGRQLALGQILAPLVILTSFQWLLLAIAAILFNNGRGLSAGLAVYGACFALVAPALNLIMLLLPNAAALLYPGWFNAAQTSGRGLEAMGQRLVLSVGLLAIFALTMIPAALAFALVYLLGAPWFLPEAAALPAASLAAAVLLGAEGWAGLAGLGYLFERLDPSAEIV